MPAKLDIRMDPAQVDAAVKGTKSNVSELAAEFAKLGPEAAKFASEIAKSYSQLQRDNAKLRGELAKVNDGTREQAREQARLKKIAQEAIEAQLGPADLVRKKQQDLTAAHKAGLLTLQQYERATREAAESLEEMGDSGAESLKGIGTQFLSLIGFSATVAGIADKVREALQDAARIREEQAGTQMTAAVAQAEVVKMLGAPEKAQQFLASAESARADVKFQDVDAWNTAAANVLSATAGNQELTLSILKTIAPLQKNKPAELSALSGAVADIATLQGAVSEADVQQVFSMVIESIGQSRITNYQAFKEAAAATAAALQTDSAAQAEITGGGGDATERSRAIREAQAAFAAVGGAIKDPMGSQTKTAVAALATQLEEFLPAQDVVVPLSDEERASTEARIAKLTEEVAAFDAQQAAAAEGVSPEEQAAADAKRRQLAELRTQTPRHASDRARVNAQARELEAELADFDAQVQARQAPSEAETAAADAKRQQIAGLQKKLTGVETEGTGLRTLAERIRAVQESPELQAKFFETASFERPVMPVIRSLLTNRQSEAAQRFEAASGKIGVDATTYQRTVEALQTASPQLQLQERAKSAEALVSEFDVGATQSGVITQAEQIATQGLERTRRGWGVIDYINETAPMIGTGGRIQGAGLRGADAAVEEAQAQLLTRRGQILGETQGYLETATPEAQRRRQQAISRIGTDEEFNAAQRASLAALPEDQRKQVELLNGLLGELKALREQAEATKRANERTADALTIAPGAGASAAAAVPPVQRLGR